MKTGTIPFGKAFVKITLASGLCVLGYLGSALIQFPTILRAVFENFEARDNIALLIICLTVSVAFPLVLNTLLHPRADMEHLTEIDYRQQAFTGWRNDARILFTREFPVLMLLVLLSFVMPLIMYGAEGKNLIAYITALYMPMTGCVSALSKFLPFHTAVVFGSLWNLVLIAGEYTAVVMLARRRAVRILKERNLIRIEGKPWN
ncbi:MAG: hypothetical protein IJX93_04505 [Clostridia bacterium]|nr:hypothetical protein [Clostridia bacterium]